MNLEKIYTKEAIWHGNAGIAGPVLLIMEPVAAERAVEARNP